MKINPISEYFRECRLQYVRVSQVRHQMSSLRTLEPFEYFFLLGGRGLQLYLQIRKKYNLYVAANVIIRCIHSALATGVVCKHGKFTPPYNWCYPICDWHVFWFSDQSLRNLCCFWTLNSNISRYCYFIHHYTSVLLMQTSSKWNGWIYESSDEMNASMDWWIDGYFIHSCTQQDLIIKLYLNVRLFFIETLKRQYLIACVWMDGYMDI